MLPSTIPTSFVPHSAGATTHRFNKDLSNTFGIFAYIVLGVIFALAVGVFSYDRILSNNKSVKDAELAKAKSAIDLTLVESFIRLRNRLETGATLLANHSAFSGFFGLLETVMPSTVRFISLDLVLTDAKGAKIEGTGFAKSFNALAAASAAFATDGHIKDAVFSNIVVNSKDNSVSFVLTATLDPKVIVFSPAVSEPASQGNPPTTPAL